MLFSISIPILIVSLLFPEWQNRAWVGRRGLIALGVLLVGNVLLGLFFGTPFRPPLIPYTGAILAVGAAALLAYRLPMPRAPALAATPARPLAFGVTGFLITVGLFFMAWGLPNTPAPPLLTLALQALLAAGSLGWVLRLARAGVWQERSLAALASGGLLFFAILAPFSEMDSSRVDNPAGMGLVGLVAALLLIYWNWRLWINERGIFRE